MDGLGALIISPTRELALQIFDELRKVGKQHQFSAGLLIGGKQVKAEQQHVNGEPSPPLRGLPTHGSASGFLHEPGPRN